MAVKVILLGQSLITSPRLGILWFHLRLNFRVKGANVSCTCSPLQPALRHCYIAPAARTQTPPVSRIERWLAVFAERSPRANLVLLGGEPTLHPDLPRAVRCARQLGFASITIDTNGYLFHDILGKVTAQEVDVFSFSLDGATAETNDRIRGKGSFEVCLNGIRRAKARVSTSASSTPSAEPTWLSCPRWGRC
jgi:organic radical activating enzyme